MADTKVKEIEAAAQDIRASLASPVIELLTLAVQEQSANFIQRVFLKADAKADAIVARMDALITEKIKALIAAEQSRDPVHRSRPSARDAELEEIAATFDAEAEDRLNFSLWYGEREGGPGDGLWAIFGRLPEGKLKPANGPAIAYLAAKKRAAAIRAMKGGSNNPKPNPALAKLLRSKAPWEPPTSGETR